MFLWILPLFILIQNLIWLTHNINFMIDQFKWKQKLCIFELWIVFTKCCPFFFNQQTIWLPLWITNNNFLLSKIWKRIFSSINFIIWSFNMLELSTDSPKINWLISLWSSIKYGHNRVYNSFQLAKFERKKLITWPFQTL